MIISFDNISLLLPNSYRHIPNEVIRELVDAKLLYQTERDIKGTLQGKEQIFKKANAVFVHTDDNGNAVGGEIQGLDIRKRYKGMVAGTGESFFKFVPVKEAKVVRAFVFESAIDLMSFYSMCNDKSKLKGTMLVSMAGLKPHVVRMLREKEINVISAVDNDEAGRKFEKEILTIKKVSRKLLKLLSQMKKQKRKKKW